MKQYLTAISALMISINLNAESSDHDHDHSGQHRQHDAHVHGLAELVLAQDGNLLELSLESPSANIVGFEHRASTDKQKHTVEKAKAMLESPNKLFSFSGTSCKVKQTTIDVSALIHDDEHHDEKHHDKHHDEKHDDKHHDEKHDDKHHDEKHDDKHHDDKHSDKHHDEDEHKEIHSEITAHYRYDCKQGAQLTSVSVNLLDHFPGIEELNVKWVTDTKQGAVELTAKSKNIRLR